MFRPWGFLTRRVCTSTQQIARAPIRNNHAVRRLSGCRLARASEHALGAIAEAASDQARSPAFSPGATRPVHASLRRADAGGQEPGCECKRFKVIAATAC